MQSMPSQLRADDLVPPIAALTLGRLIIKIRKYSRRSIDGSTKILEIMQETVLGARIVKSFNLEATMKQRMAVAVLSEDRFAGEVAASCSR